GCQCNVAPAARHSFPTRRSSDLKEAPELEVVIARQSLQPASEIAPQHGQTAHQCRVCRQVINGDRKIIQRRRAHEVLAEASAIADRKSTRLNSSHVKISYAVFCL